MPEIWEDRLFWALVLGGLLAYLLVFFIGSSILLVGSLLWILAFIYLIVSSIKKWTKVQKPG